MNNVRDYYNISHDPKVVAKTLIDKWSPELRCNKEVTRLYMILLMKSLMAGPDGWISIMSLNYLNQQYRLSQELMSQMLGDVALTASVSFSGQLGVLLIALIGDENGS